MGWCFLMRLLSSMSASSSLSVTIQSRSAISKTIRRILRVWSALLWKYCRTRLRSIFALPT